MLEMADSSILEKGAAKEAAAESAGPNWEPQWVIEAPRIHREALFRTDAPSWFGPLHARPKRTKDVAGSLKRGRIKELSVQTGLPMLPGGRYISEGKNSAEEFRDTHLAPALKDEDSYDQVRVDFGGVTDFSAAFLDEAFGGLVRQHKMDGDFLKKRLVICTSEGDMEDYVRMAKRYIDHALSK